MASEAQQSLLVDVLPTWKPTKGNRREELQVLHSLLGMQLAEARTTTYKPEQDVEYMLQLTRSLSSDRRE